MARTRAFPAILRCVIAFAIARFACCCTLKRDQRLPAASIAEAVEPVPACGKETLLSQSFTFIDPGGNHAQYTVYEADHHNEYYWSTDHGDHGLAPSYVQAQDCARTVLKASMAIRRRSARDR